VEGDRLLYSKKKETADEVSEARKEPGGRGN